MKKKQKIIVSILSIIISLIISLVFYFVLPKFKNNFSNKNNIEKNQLNNSINKKDNKKEKEQINKNKQEENNIIKPQEERYEIKDKLPDVSYGDKLEFKGGSFSANSFVPKGIDDIYRTYSQNDALEKKRVYSFIKSNEPSFPQEYFDKMYSYDKVYLTKLDAKKRLRLAFGKINFKTLPNEERGEINHIKPAGYRSEKYFMVEGGWLYNRAHLIGFQLSGLNDVKQNLVTGTRFLNIQGMVEIENEIKALVVRNKNIYVMYAVDPIYFEESELVPRGLHIMAQTFNKKDDTKYTGDDAIKYNIFSFNYQPGFELDYKTGKIKSIVPYEKLTNGEKAYVNKYIKNDISKYGISSKKKKNKAKNLLLFLEINKNSQYLLKRVEDIV